MSEVKLTVPAPKEFVDVLSALDGLVSKLVAKEPLAQLVAEEFQVLVKLFGEFQPALAEAQGQTDECLDAGALFGRRLAYRLLGKAVVPVTVTA